MALPAQPTVTIRFGTGASFGNALVLGSATQGILGTNVLGTTAAAPVNVSNQVDSINIRRGRDRVFDQYNNGQCTIRLIDETGDFNPQNPSSPYFGEILPMRQLRISTSYNNVTYWLFSGYITSWDYEWDKAADVAFVTVTAEDAFRLLNLSTVSTVAGSTAGDLPGTRINQILDQIIWPNDLRQIDNGQVTLQDDPGTARKTLDALRTVEASELGALYIDAQGRVVFKGRSNVAIQASGTKTVFDDDGTDIGYQEIDVALDDTELANYVTVTREGGTEQVASDATSITQFFQREFSRSGLLMQTDTQAAAQASTILAYRKDIELRVVSVGLDLSSVSNRIAAGLGLDIGDPIRVIRTQPGGSKITVDLTVQGVSHDIRPDRWRTRFSTAQPLGYAFVLGSTEFGVLGTSTL